MTKEIERSRRRRVWRYAVEAMAILSIVPEVHAFDVRSVGTLTDRVSWATCRGANTGRGLSEADVRDFAGLGGNVLRLSLPTLPLMKLEPDYAFNEQAFAYVERVLDW